MTKWRCSKPAWRACSIPVVRSRTSPPMCATRRRSCAARATQPEGPPMNRPLRNADPARPEDARIRWESEYRAQIGNGREIRNRSGVAIQPLYGPGDGDASFPGQYPYTRGIYATMHRGRTWTQRQLIGLGTPRSYNDRLRDILAQGANAVSLIPCNSV